MYVESYIRFPKTNHLFSDQIIMNFMWNDRIKFYMKLYVSLNKPSFLKLSNYVILLSIFVVNHLVQRLHYQY